MLESSFVTSIFWRAIFCRFNDLSTLPLVSETPFCSSKYHYVTWGANFKNKTISSHVYQHRTSRYFDLHSQLDGVPYPQTILKSTFQRSLSRQNGFWRKWQHLWRFSVLVRQSKKPKSRQALCVFTDAPLWNGTWTGMLLVNRTGTRLLFLSVNGGVPHGLDVI